VTVYVVCLFVGWIAVSIMAGFALAHLSKSMSCEELDSEKEEGE
jgi:hypothetical protein